MGEKTRQRLPAIGGKKMDTMIKVKNLHKTFGTNQVLKGINTEIKKGEVVVVIGPSGSGKSTFYAA